MPSILVFAGEKHYPKGGAHDLWATYTQRPSEQDLIQVFLTAAEQENWLNDDYWMNTVTLGPDGVPTSEHWLVYIRDTNEALDFEEARYASETISWQRFKVLFVPVVEREEGGVTWIGPRDFPNVTFY